MTMIYLRFNSNKAFVKDDLAKIINKKHNNKFYVKRRKNKIHGRVTVRMSLDN